MKFSLLAFLILIVSCAKGQSTDNYKDGFVVLINSDTLYGQVMDRDESAFGGLLDKIRFRPEKGRKRKYKPSQILAYNRGDHLFRSIWLSTESKVLKQYYFNRPGQGEQVFMEVIHEGSIELYHWEYTDEDNSTIHFIPLLKKAGSEEMVRATQGILGLKRKRLAEYFLECPALTRKLLTKEITTVEQVINLYEAQCAY